MKAQGFKKIGVGMYNKIGINFVNKWNKLANREIKLFKTYQIIKKKLIKWLN